MPIVTLRLLGSQTDADALIGRLHGLEDIQHVEQVADLMDHMDDEDSSSSGLPDDIGAGVRLIEVRVRSDDQAERVRRFAARAAEDLDASLEFVDEP